MPDDLKLLGVYVPAQSEVDESKLQASLGRERTAVAIDFDEVHVIDIYDERWSSLSACKRTALGCGMLEVRNTTPFTTERAILHDGDGREHWCVAIKGTFLLRDGEPPEPLEHQEPVNVAPVHYGPPDASSMRYDNELVRHKPATDVTLLGHAHAPQGTTRMDVTMRVGPIHKTLHVTGDRFWRGPVASWPERFTQMPIVWERAHGGTDQRHHDPAKHQRDPRNPVGRGFSAGMGSPDDQLPNIELPSGDGPGGFGPIARSWQPRLQHAGTYDEAWQRTRMPLWPRDLDPRFFQSAPTDQIASLRGGESIELVGLTPSGHLRSHLPRISLGVRTFLGTTPHLQEVQLQTVILEPDAERMMLVWGSSICSHGRKHDIRFTHVWLKERR